MTWPTVVARRRHPDKHDLRGRVVTTTPTPAPTGASRSDHSGRPVGSELRPTERMRPYVLLCLLLALTETAAGWPRPEAQSTIGSTASPTAPAAEDVPRLSPPEAADAERSGRPPGRQSGPGDRGSQREPSSRGGDVFTTDDGLKDRHTADNDTHHGHVHTPEVEGDETEVSTGRTATARSTTSRSTTGSSTTTRSTTEGSTTVHSTTGRSTTEDSTTESSTTTPTKRKSLRIPGLLAILRGGTRPLFEGQSMGGSNVSYTYRTTESYQYEWTTHSYDRPRTVRTGRSLRVAISLVVGALFLFVSGVSALIKMSRKRREAQARQAVGGQREQPAGGHTERPFGGQSGRPFGGQTERPFGDQTERPFGGQIGRPGQGQSSAFAVQTDNKVYCVIVS